MLGKNKVKLIEVKARRSEYDKPLFELTFTRGSALYDGKKIDFAPMSFIFAYPDDRLVELCACFGDSLSLPLSPDREYLNGLYTMLKSYIGKELNANIRQRKILSRDKYGRPQVDDNPMLKRIDPIIINLSDVASFGDVLFKWAEAILPLSEKDNQDLEMMNETLKK